MTNETNYKPCLYKCNGATKDFPFDFQVHKNDKTLKYSDLIVTLVNTETQEETVLTENTNYTVLADTVGGNITTTTAYSTEYNIVISRKTSFFQGKSFATSAGFQASEVENAFDRVSCGLQDMDYNIKTFKEEYSAETNQKIEDFKNTVNENVSAMDNRVTTNTNNIQKHVIDVNKALAEFEPLFNEKLDIAQGYAETSETNATIAVNAKNNAETYMNNAKTYMNNAETYQNNALTYKNSANSSATVTTDKANEALTSANIATQKAKETSDYAQFAADCLASCQSIQGQFGIVSFLSGGSSANILQEDIYDGGSSSVFSENVYSGGNSEYKNVLTYDDIKKVHEITALQALVKTLVNRIEALENIKTISGGVAVA